MNFNASAAFVIFLGLFTIGSGIKCYLCSALLSNKCSSGEHSVDNITMHMMECDGKCLKLSPPYWANASDITAKMCAPFIEQTRLKLGELETYVRPVTIAECERNQYCYVCDNDFCNAAEKITGVTFSIALTLSMLIFVMF